VERKVVAYFVVLYQHLTEVTDDSQDKMRKSISQDSHCPGRNWKRSAPWMQV